MRDNSRMPALRPTVCLHAGQIALGSLWTIRTER